MRDNNFIFLRFITAIGILMGHLAYHTGIHAFGYSETKSLYHIGLELFFIISAFFLYPS